MEIQDLLDRKASALLVLGVKLVLSEAKVSLVNLLQEDLLDQEATQDL